MIKSKIINANIPYSPSRLDSTLFLVRNKKSFIHAKNVLDVGCGKLYFFEVLRILGFKENYLGLDINPGFIRDKPSFKSNIVRESILDYKTKKKFDFVACFWVLEHIKSDSEVVEILYRITKKNGIVILGVPSIYSFLFEFGKHGYHYYSKKKISKMVSISKFEIIKSYSSGGILGYFFMLFYSWPRYLILVSILPVFLLLKVLNLFDMSWKQFSVSVINNTIYFYHRYPTLVKIHNYLVRSIVQFDNKFKMLPASYILVLKRR